MRERDSGNRITLSIIMTFKNTYCTTFYIESHTCTYMYMQCVTHTQCVYASRLPS